MNNEELKKKIAIAAAHSYDDWVEEDYARRIQKIDFDKLADALIAAGIGDVKAMKEIKYRVRRAEKALYIACRETAEIIFKDDFDRHAQEYMYGYLKQAEKELAEEKKK